MMYNGVTYRQQHHDMRPLSSVFERGKRPDAPPLGSWGLDRDTMLHTAREGGRPSKVMLHSHLGQKPYHLLSPPSPRAPQPHGAEHMLRRKTPSGTLAAGYDGRSFEWSARPPANKHFIMPALNDDGSATAQSHATLANANLPQVGPSSSVFDLEHIEGTFHDHYGQSRQHVETFSSDCIVPSEAQPFANTGVDSVLYQSSPSHQLGNYSGGQHFPMVMQPMWPPCVGITSLNSPGPYGPYWPDGAFVPYRPAPIRDPRFQYDSASLAPSGIWQNPQASFERSSIYPYKVLRPPEADVSGHSTRRLQKAQGSRVSKGQNSTSSLGQGLSLNLPSRGTTPGVSSSSHFDSNLSTHAEQDVIPTQTRAGSSLCDFSIIPPLSSLAYPRGIDTSNIDFKERVLIWAHRVYLSLSCSKQQSRRLGPSVQYQNYQHPTEKISSYMPHRSFPKLPNTKNSSRLIPEQHSHINIKSQGFLHRSHEGPERIEVMHRIPAHDQTPFVASPTYGPDSRYTEPYGSPSPLSTQSNSRSVSDSFQGSQSHRDRTPAAVAITAIQMLSRLCHESGWEWTDGMLLGGCLAYALGDYCKALRWYSKVLSCDANNVEAISNVAATLLSLDRKQEAEDYWLRAVRLRPSYFEAVEHLVGIYCDDHRGKEAVQLIEFVEKWLQPGQARGSSRHVNEPSSTKHPSSVPPIDRHTHPALMDISWGQERAFSPFSDTSQSVASSGYAILPSDHGRLLSLIHGKGNMLYALGDNAGAAKAFENVILIGSAQQHLGIRGLIRQILDVFSEHSERNYRVLLNGNNDNNNNAADEPILLCPDVALETSKLVFPPYGNLPGLQNVPTDMAKRAGISIVSNSLLSLAKIYQDGMSSSGAAATGPRASSGVKEILALYYLSLSLQPSPSTANNVGILLASVQQPGEPRWRAQPRTAQIQTVPGIVRGSGIDLALAYYNYGLNLDPRHAHLYTNLGSLFKDIGHLTAAIKMYEKAVQCDGSFDIALANLANAVKDQGRIGDAIEYYRRAVAANPDFAEAVCGLANALNSVCNWHGRGGVRSLGANRDRWHVSEQGMLYDRYATTHSASGWIERVVNIVDKQLREGENWGKGILQSVDLDYFSQQLRYSYSRTLRSDQSLPSLGRTIEQWINQPWEGAKVVRSIERATKRLVWQVYRDKFIRRRSHISIDTTRPQLPAALAVPTAPTVLPFHTFTCPLSAKQIRKISQRNGLRISCSTLRAAWLPRHIYEPPAPPKPQLVIGYVSSDFNNHPLAHLMQSVFGFHDPRRFRAICYATTTGDGSVHRQQIEQEAPMFYDASSWPLDKLINQIVGDGVHVLVNLNGYTRGAKNEVFAARPAPIQMSFMGFAGTLGAEWCDYLLADKIAIPPQTLRPYRHNVDLADQLTDGNNQDDEDEWVYGENIIFTRDTFFCCDHRQSAPDAREPRLDWEEEQRRRWAMRKELFPKLPDDTVILGNFNQLYKIDPATFRTWLRILSRVPKAVLWLLRFPDLGETNLRETAMSWVGSEVASRVLFTDVAPKHQHIARARVCDLFLDTPECNAHTTAADVLWSGTPLLTFPRYDYKMCSRIAASILAGALPKSAEGDRAREDLVVQSDEDYEERAVELGIDLVYPTQGGCVGIGQGRLVELRRLLYENRWTSALFDTRRWVRDLETAYDVAWERWVAGEGGDIWL